MKSTAKNFFKRYSVHELTAEQHISAIHVAEEATVEFVRIIQEKMKEDTIINSLLLNEDRLIIDQAKDLILTNVKELIKDILIL